MFLNKNEPEDPFFKPKHVGLYRISSVIILTIWT